MALLWSASSCTSLEQVFVPAPPGDSRAQSLVIAYESRTTHFYGVQPNEPIELPIQTGTGELFALAYSSSLNEMGIEPGLLPEPSNRSCLLAKPLTPSWRIEVRGASTRPEWAPVERAPGSVIEGLVDNAERCGECPACTTDYEGSEVDLGFSANWQSQELITIAEDRALMLRSSSGLVSEVDPDGVVSPLSAMDAALSDLGPPAAAVITSSGRILILLQSGDLIETSSEDLSDGTIRRLTTFLPIDANRLVAFDVWEGAEGDDILVADSSGRLSRWRGAEVELIKSAGSSSATPDVAFVESNHAFALWRSNPAELVELQADALQPVRYDQLGVPTAIERFDSLGTYLATEGGGIHRYQNNAWVQAAPRLVFGPLLDIAHRGRDVLAVGPEATLQELDPSGASCILTGEIGFPGAAAITALGDTVLTLPDRGDSNLLFILAPSCR